MQLCTARENTESSPHMPENTENSESPLLCVPRAEARLQVLAAPGLLPRAARGPAKERALVSWQGADSQAMATVLGFSRSRLSHRQRTARHDSRCSIAVSIPVMDPSRRNAQQFRLWLT